MATKTKSVKKYPLMGDLPSNPKKQSELKLSFYEGDCLAFFLNNEGSDSFVNCIEDFGYSRKEAKLMARSITDRVSHHAISAVYADAEKHKSK